MINTCKAHRTPGEGEAVIVFDSFLCPICRVIKKLKEENDGYREQTTELENKIKAMKERTSKCIQ